MYKILAIDLDGTLLDSYGDISDENKKWIKKAKQVGIEVVLTSGRTAKSVIGIAKEIEADKFMICRKWCNCL